MLANEIAESCHTASPLPPCNISGGVTPLSFSMAMAADASIIIAFGASSAAHSDPAISVYGCSRKQRHVDAVPLSLELGGRCRA